MVWTCLNCPASCGTCDRGWDFTTKSEVPVCILCPNGLLAVRGFCCPNGTYPYNKNCVSYDELKSNITSANQTTPTTLMTLADIVTRL